MFTTKPVKTQTLGEFLTSRREALGLTLADVLRLTAVQPKYLAALEDSRFMDLPAPVYVKGFLRNLAKLYHADSNLLLSQFSAEQGIEENIKLLETEAVAKKFVMPSIVLTPKILTILVASLLGVLSLGYFYYELSSLRRPPRLEIFSPSVDGAVATSLVVVRGQTEPGAVVYINDQNIVVSANGNFEENLSLGPGVNQFMIRAINKFKQETKLVRSLVSSQSPPGPAASATSTVLSQDKNLTLEIVIGPKASWISVSADGQENFSALMLPAARKIITAQDKISLTTGNAGVTHVIFQGKDLGLLGKDGEALRDLEFTR